MELKQAINERRSVRRYKSDPVPEALVEKIIEAARFAPSWANTQVTRFFAVRDQEVKQEILAAVPEFNPVYKALGQAPLIIVVGGVREKAGFYRGVQSNRHGDYAMFDVALAVENAVLAAHDLGLATCLVGVFDIDRVKEILDFAPEVDPFVLTPLGYSDQEELKVPPRKEVSELLAWR